MIQTTPPNDWRPTEDDLNKVCIVDYLASLKILPDEGHGDRIYYATTRVADRLMTLRVDPTTNTWQQRYSDKTCTLLDLAEWYWKVPRQTIVACYKDFGFETFI